MRVWLENAYSHPLGFCQSKNGGKRKLFALIFNLTRYGHDPSTHKNSRINVSRFKRQGRNKRTDGQTDRHDRKHYLSRVRGQ